MSTIPGTSAQEERWHFGRLIAICTFAVVVILCVLPVSAFGSTDSCGTAIGAAMARPGPPNDVDLTPDQLCHPLGVDRLWDAARVLLGGLLLSAVVGHFAQPRRNVG